ncbi:MULTISPECIES: TonB-dependent siderophore receptor [unclassified Azospirillum]|uniref:TonB-dependent receptor plug domain-containing protein n=1 Tax=unclassified Azospirillum TaxID=2630922 RepID=UPI000B63A7B4|nr:MULTISPECIES: TonB-dependent receptor [unclassified Azospirillum]SNR92059.1 vitamin B12 transporter [Azospirillum sp. RU38E]SNS07974.1 vitamin B12 transporter [Azospirillum sp. RU37A]
MTNNQVSRLALMALAGLTTLPAAADVQVAQTEEIIVTGRSLEETLPQELAAYGSDLEIIGERQIKEGGFRDVSQALQMLTPGLYLMPNSGPFSYVDISLQGSRTQDVLWLVDGVRINNRLYGTTTPADTLPASMVERIEVLKGGQSLFFGTQAAAGAINVVTRGFSDTPDGQANIGFDTRGTYHLDGYVRGRIDAHKLVLYATKEKAEGYRPYTVMQPSATQRDRGFDVRSAGLKYGTELAEDLSLELSYQHTDAKVDFATPARTLLNYNDRDEEIASLRLDYTPTGIAQFFLKGYFHDWDTKYANIQNSLTGGPPVVINPPGTYWGYRDYGVNGVLKLALHRGVDYLLGYDFQNFHGRDDVLLIAGKTEQVHAGILQIRSNDDLSSDLKLAAGVRYNHTDAADSTVWNVSGRYDFSEALYLEGVGGTSFLLPSAEQLFAVDPCCARGNPKLAPERSLSANLSLGGALETAGRITWQVTGFARRINNLITDTYSNPAFPDGIYINEDRKVQVRGGEFQVGWQPDADWRLDASYTHTRSRNQGSDQQRDRIPTDFAKAGISYQPVDRLFGADLAVSWTGDSWQTVSGFGRRHYGNHVVTDLGAHLFLDSERRHRLGVRLENLFDEEYATRLGSAAADAGGRFLYGYRGVPRTLHVNYGVHF